MEAQLYVCEQVPNTFVIWNKQDNEVVYTANSLHNAVDFCYSAGYNFEVEINENMTYEVD